MHYLKKVMFFTLIAISTTAFAAPNLTLTTATEREVVTIDDNGVAHTQRIATTEVEPGDTLFITLTVTNAGDETATSIDLQNPIPQGTELIPNSVWGNNATITYSVDQGKLFAAAESLEVAKSSIGLSTRPATVEDYTHIRWVVEKIDAGNSASVGFSAIVK